MALLSRQLASAALLISLTLAPAVSTEIKFVYRTDRQIRIEWDPYSLGRVEHYDVVLSQRGEDKDIRQVLRTQVPPEQNSFVFTNLHPATDYVVAVLAVVSGAVRQNYQMSVQTARRGAEIWASVPRVSPRALGRFQVEWGSTDIPADSRGFVIEYRWANDTNWHRHGQQIPIQTGRREYSTVVEGPPGRLVYVFRVYAVNEQGEVLAVTEEFNVGSGTERSCAGPAGVPLDVQSSHINPVALAFSWAAPTCDETFGPIEGYEYKFWAEGADGREPERPAFTSDRRVTFDRLQPERRYAFKVRCRSRGGFSPWAQPVHANTKKVTTDLSDRPHHLRVLLADPTPFLAWQPPRERGKIIRYRLRIGKSDKDDLVPIKYRVIDEPVANFRCPPGIGNPGDLCFELNNVELGTQHNAHIGARMESGQWTQEQNLAFVLVEALVYMAAGGEPRPDPPRIKVEQISESRAEISWTPPAVERVSITEYKLSIRIVTTRNKEAQAGNIYTLTVPGTTLSQTIENLLSETTYNISVESGHNGNFGPAAWTIFVPKEERLEVKLPTVSQRGGTVTINWQVVGTAAGLYGYHVDVRKVLEPDWRPVGSTIPHRHGQNSYSADLPGLEGNTEYYMRVRAISAAQLVLATSPNVRLITQCTPPLEAPADVRGVSPDPRSIRLTWRAPDRSRWNCNEIFFYIEGSPVGQPPQRFQTRPDPRSVNVDHSIPAEPGSQWRLRVQTVNSGGVSSWSDYVTVDVESEAYVSTPRLSPKGGEMQVDWQSQGRGAGKVYGYQVEYRSSAQPIPQRYGSVVPFRGDNQAYSTSMSGLQVGLSYFVKILVFDRSQRIIYTSPEATAETRCEAPTEPPTTTELGAPDSRHVRVRWEAPPVETWRCNDISFELEILDPRGLGSRQFGGNQNQEVFDAKPNQKWRIRMRTRNSAGASVWSKEQEVTVPLPGELIEGLQVIYQNQIPTLTWRSAQNVEDLVAGYKVEFGEEADRRMRPHSSGLVRFVGAQRPYHVSLEDLPEGQSYVRLHVIDANQGIAYTSASLPVQISPKCRTPTTPPRDLQVRGSSGDQITLMWNPVSRAEWNCDRLWYIVSYSTLRGGRPVAQGFRNFTATESVGIFESDPATTWVFKIQSANPSGSSPWSREIRGEVEESLPGPVKGVVVTPISPESAQVRWQIPDDPNGVISGYDLTYRLLSRGQCGESPERDITVTTRDLSYVLQNLIPHSRYRLSIAAKTRGVGAPVSKDFETDQSVPTAPPQAVQARSENPTSASVSWQAPPCIQTNGEIVRYEYSLEGVDPWATAETKVLTATETRGRADGLTPFTRYRVKVRGYTTRGPGPWSPEVFVTTKGADSPPPPPLVKVTGTTADTVGLIWQSPFPPHGEIDEYKVQFTQAGTEDWRSESFSRLELRCPPEYVRLHQLGTRGADVFCATITGLSPARVYELQVAGHIADKNWGRWSSKVTANTEDGGPIPILGLEQVGAEGENYLNIRWFISPADTGRARGFKILVHPAEDNRRPQQYTVDGTTYTYRVEDLEANSVYNISLQGRTDSGFHRGISKLFRTAEGRVPSLDQPPTVTERRADSLVVTWLSPSPSAGLTGFLLEYQSPPGSEWQKSGGQIPAEPRRPEYTGTIGRLTPNSDVRIRVRPVGRNGRQGEPSPEAQARTECRAPSSPPQSVRADAPSPQQVRLSWQMPEETSWHCDQIGYEIAYKSDRSAKEQIQRVAGQQTEFLFPSGANVRWHFKVRTTNRAGQSGYAEEVEVTTLAGAPEKVRNLVVTPLSPNDVKVSWTEPHESHGVITGYDISYRLIRRMSCPASTTRDNWITVYNVPTTEHEINGLLPYSEYEIRVAARTTELGPTESKTITTEQTAPTAPPRNALDKFKLERSITFSWDPPPCEQQHGAITSYQYELLGLDDWAKLDVRIANTTQTQVNIDGLTPFTKYRFKVKAYTSQGSGPSTSNLDTMTTEAEAPLSPQDLTVVQEGTDHIIISWLPPYPPYGHIDLYRIRYKQTSGGRGDWTDLDDLAAGSSALRCDGAAASIPRLCYKISGLDSGVAYAVQAAAHIKDRSYGQWSPQVSANTLDRLPNEIRSIGIKDRTPNSLTVGWEPPVDPLSKISHYQIFVLPTDVRTGSDRPKTFTVESPKTSYVIENLEPDSTYNVSVAAGTRRGFGRGVSVLGTTESGVVPSVTLAPTITSAGSDFLTVEWIGVTGAKDLVIGYLVEFRPYDDPTFREFGEVVRHEDSKRSYVQKISGLNPDTTYVVEVKVVDRKNRVSNPSPTVEGRTGCEAPNSPPLNIRGGAPTATQVRVTWQSPPPSTWRCGTITYRLRYKNGTSAPWAHLDLPSSRNDHTFNSPPFTKWSVQMRSQNSAGHSDWTPEIVVETPPAAPGKVLGLSGAAAGPDRARVQWEPPADPNGIITDYILTYTLKASGACPIALSQPVVKQVHQEKQIIKELAAASTYEVTVAARTTEVGPPSDPILITTEESSPTGAPERVEAGLIQPTAAVITWDEPPCDQRNGLISRYEYVLEGLDPWAQGDAQKASVAVERVELAKLTPFTRYSFKVRGLNGKGGGPFSEPIEILTKPGAPPAPNGVRSEGESPHSILVSFMPPSPPHGKLDDYRIRHTGTDRINWVEVRRTPEELVCPGNLGDKIRLCAQLSDLDPEREYAVQVAGHTDGGDWGEWSKAVYIKTKDADLDVPPEPKISDRKATSLTLIWEGASGKHAAGVDGYILEFNSGESSQWLQYEDVIPSKGLQGGLHSKVVTGLQPDSFYFFRLKAVHKNGKQGQPGPVAREKTACGKPTQPPQNIKVSAVDFNGVKITWDPPAQKTWKCGHVSLTLKFQNDTTTTAQMKLFSPAEKGLQVFEAQPSSTWTFQMRTEAIEEGKVEPGDWSDDKSVTVPSGIPGDIFMELRPVDPDKAEVTWELPDEDRKYPYGVDIQYQLVQRGTCPSAHFEPSSEYNVQERRKTLKDLEPYSKYEVTIKPRTPPYLVQAGRLAPKKVDTVRTGEAEPTGPPNNVRLLETPGRDFLSFTWDLPDCDKQNGQITQYEYLFTGLDDWVKGDLRQASTSRRKVSQSDLAPGTRYRFQVRAYTSAGPGPWSAPLDVKTEGSELGPPREIHPVSVNPRRISLTWQPPSPLRSRIDKYRLKYGKGERAGQKEDEVAVGDLKCDKFGSALITPESLCHTLKGLNPAQTYQIQAQAHASGGSWGDWSPVVFVTTKDGSDPDLPGSLKLVSAEPDKLKVKWTPPGAIDTTMSFYLTSISEVGASRPAVPPPMVNVSKQLSHEFRQLTKAKNYNITVEGYSAGERGDVNPRLLWYISKIFQTPDIGDLYLPWLTAPSNLRLLEKSETAMHLTWDPPEILLPAYADLITHYLVTYAPYDPERRVTGTPVQLHVPRPGLRVWLRDLEPSTIYNITVQAGARQGLSEVLWGSYSTLDPGQPHILRLKYRTPTSLHVQWTPVWGTAVPGYRITAEPLHSVDPFADLHAVHNLQAAGGDTELLIKGLHPQTIYRVTLQPLNVESGTWGAYATLPPGSFMVSNLKICSKTPFAAALSWTPIDDASATATGYRIRYMKSSSAKWVELPEKSRHHLRCPGDPCETLCSAVINLEEGETYTFQVQAHVEGSWNRYKTAMENSAEEVPRGRKSCCVVPPPYFVSHIGDEGTMMSVQIRPVPNATYVQRYYVIVDERDPPGEINETLLFDKITAKAMRLPYYITGAFDKYTLTDEMDFPIGDAKVYGGFINYPLVKGKKYNWAFATIWMVDGKPIYGMLRDSSVHARYLGGGWEWWWILLLLLLILLLILLCCCLLWCCANRYRKKRQYGAYTLVNGGRSSALMGVEEDKKEKGEMASSLKALENRIDNIRSQLETKIHTTNVKQDYASRDGDRDSDTSSVEGRLRGRGHRGKGDFEEGYVRGFRDSHKVSSGTMAKRRLDDEYGGMKADFHQGYIQGLRDAGLSGLSTSMHNLTLNKRADTGGYSAGYMQGFREGNTGLYGERVTNSLLRRLEDLYPNQEEFKTGYLDGYRDAIGNKQTDTLQSKASDGSKLTERLSEISERLQSLEKSKVSTAPGDEIHTTKIYHVYNQLPEGAASVGAGTQLAQELEEINQSSSRRSTLRRHYTPGDYLKYASDNEGGGYPTESIRRSRRTLSASNVGRDEFSADRTMDGRSRYDSRVSVNAYNDTFARRYQYRSRSDVGAQSGTLARRYGSQTLLEGPRPGPSTPGDRREALEALQRELNTLGRSGPAAPKPFTSGRGRSADYRGYSSDTAGADTWRSKYGGAVASRKPAEPTDNLYATANPNDYGRESMSRRHYYSRQSNNLITTTTRVAATNSGRMVDSRFLQVPSRSAAAVRSPADTYRSEVSASRSHKATRTFESDLMADRSGPPTPPGVPPGAPPKERLIFPPPTLSSSSGGAAPTSPSSSGAAARPDGAALAQAYNLIGLSAAETSGSELDRTDQASWTDELMRIATEPMDRTLDRMKEFNAHLSQLPPSPSPMATDSAAPQPRRDRSAGGTEIYTETYDSAYSEKQSGGAKR